ncbi:MAG: patatin-like phospholipase family protein [Janthinobacterium lividum]
MKGVDQDAPTQGRPQHNQASAPTNGTVGAQPVTSTGRKRIGLALGGGGALALSEIGVLRWMEDNHVPIDVIAGTSMGSLVGALYATGHTPKQMAELTSDKVFSQVFRVSDDFRKQNFRRREDGRFLPGGFTVGLRHGVSLRNGVLLDYGLNQFLNAQFLPYGAAADFDNMPLPYRCVATDILVGREAVFKRGPLAEAVRASLSIPGVFPPLEDGGHIYVDGALTENLPTDLVKSELLADVVLAVSLPLTPPDAGDTSSVLGVLQRSFSVASWSNEVRSRALADVLIEPIAPAGVGAADYAKSEQLADAGYQAAQRVAPQLLPYRVSDTEWAQYQQRRQNREPQPPRNFATINVIAPSATSAIGVRDTVIDLPGKKVDAARVDAKLDEIRSDGRFDTYYFLSKPGQVVDLTVTGPANVGRQVNGKELMHPEEKRGPGDDLHVPALQQDSAGSSAPRVDASGAVLPNATQVNNTIPVGDRGDKRGKKPQFETIAPSSTGTFATAQASLPTGQQAADQDVDLNLVVRNRPGGPPYLLLGGNVIAQTGGTARATIDGVLTAQDLGGYGSELRARFRFGFLTEFTPEYYRRLHDSRFFVAPRLNFYRTPVYIYADQTRTAERLSLTAGGGVDVGYAPSTFSEWRAGWQRNYQQWHTVTGTDGLPDFNGGAQLARVQFRYNGQDRAMVPRHGLRAEVSAGYQFHAVRSENAPRVEASGTYFRDIGHGNTLSFSVEGGTLFHRAVADPFRFTLGGPLRLTASSFEEYRGTDYAFVRPAYFRRIANLPTPLGQSIYVVGTYEFGHIETQAGSVNRQDAFFGLAAETPFGALTFGPAFGDHDHRKLVFTLGRFF